MSKYERTVTAAVAETRSKFALAQALATDIPPRRPGPGPELTVIEHLTLARLDIIRAGGEARSVETLDKFRRTALWVSAGTGRNYRWIPGISFTAHSEAREAGLSYDEFAANPKAARQTRQENGAASKDGLSVVQSWTPEQKAEAAKTLLAEPAVAEQVISDSATRLSVNRAIDTHARYQASERSQRTERIASGDPIAQRIDSLTAINALGEAAERWSREGNEALRQAGELPDSERYWLTGAIDRAEATTRAARRYLELGRSEIDAELRILLENGAS